MSVYHELTVDISTAYSGSPVTLKQGDTGRSLIIYPTQNGAPWAIPSGSVVSLRILNPLRQSTEIPAGVSTHNGKECIEAKLTAEAVAVVGICIADATIDDGETVSTLNFRLDVQPAPASKLRIPTPGGGITAEQARRIANEQIDAAKADGSWKGEKGDKGDPGAPGLPGRDGVDGADGAPGRNGTDGADGVSPVVAVSAISGGHRVTVTDADGAKSFDVLNGAKGDKGDKGDPGEGGVSQADFETYKSQVSESITDIQQQIGYAEADLAALLGEVESVVSKF